VDFGWGNPTDRKASINLLVNDRFVDPISGGTPNRLFVCEVRKASRDDAHPQRPACGQNEA